MSASTESQKPDSAAVDSSASAPQNPTEAAASQSFFQRHWQKLIAFALWIVLAAAFTWYVNSTGKGLAGSTLDLIYLMQVSAFGPLIYILVYTLRPLTLFSALLLTVSGGFLFGPFWGVVYTVIGANLSATVAYFIGRYFGSGTLDTEDSDSLIQKYANRMRYNSFETILIMRFIFLPYDLVNYLAGFLHIHYGAFILATILGSIPGTISFVLLGASASASDIEALFLQGELPSLDWRVLAASVVIFVVSLGLSQYFKRREKKETAEAGAADEASPMTPQAISTD